MNKIRTTLALVAAGAVAVTAAACGNDGGVNGGKDIDRPDFDFNYDGGTGTPAPTGKVFVDQMNTPDGSTVISLGKCLGFTLRANEEGLFFSPDAKVTVGPMGLLASTLLDGTTIRVGDPLNSYKCHYTNMWGAPGKWDVTVTDGDFSYTIPEAITVTAPKIHDIGLVEIGYDVWSMDKLTDPDASNFGVPYDVDIYRATFFDPDTTNHIFDHVDFFSTSPTAFWPVMEFWQNGVTAKYIARGGHSLIFPKRGEHYIVVRDSYGMGGAGKTYDLRFRTHRAGSDPNATDACRADTPALATTSKTYYMAYGEFTDNFNLDMQPGCADSIYGTRVKTPGHDAVMKLKVPAGQQVRITSYDDRIDNVTYLLPLSLSSGTNGCPVRPNNCVAAASRFGGGNTDALIYTNDSGAEEEFFLIHDSAILSTDMSNSFLMDVQYYTP